MVALRGNILLSAVAERVVSPSIVFMPRRGITAPLAVAHAPLHFAFEAFEGMYLFILQGEYHAGIGGEILADNT